MARLLSPFVRLSISATSEVYWDIFIPGLGPTLMAPGMWLIANSSWGRASKTSVDWLSAILAICSVEISGVGCPDSSRVALWITQGAHGAPGSVVAAAGATAVARETQVARARMRTARPRPPLRPNFLIWSRIPFLAFVWGPR